MKHVIWKFPLCDSDTGEALPVTMPRGAKILTVGVTDEVPCVWAIVDPDARKTQRDLIPVWTGDPLGAAVLGTYVGTYAIDDGQTIVHLFDMGEHPAF